MAQYDDIYIRSNFDDKGEIPTSGTLCHSPDIIPNGQKPLADPNTLISDENWDKEMGKNLIANAHNYIYVRGMNLANKAENGDVYLYYSKASLLLYPSQWKNNQLKTDDGSGKCNVSAKAIGSRVVTDNPFTWEPEYITGDHYCMVARVSTKDNPNKIPDTGDIQDFSKFICNNPGFGWRNVSVVNADSPTFTQTIEYEQGTIKAPMKFCIECTNVPVGAEVAFSCATPGPQPVINLDKTTVTNSESFIVGMSSNVPKNFKSNISYSYWSNGKKPLKGFKIRLYAIYLVATDNELYDFAMDHPTFSVALNSEDEFNRAIGPTKAIIVGAHESVNAE
jgi:hypothetical protein